MALHPFTITMFYTHHKPSRGKRAYLHFELKVLLNEASFFDYVVGAHKISRNDLMSFSYRNSRQLNKERKQSKRGNGIAKLYTKNKKFFVHFFRACIRSHQFVLLWINIYLYMHEFYAMRNSRQKRVQTTTNDSLQ